MEKDIDIAEKLKEIDTEIKGKKSKEKKGTFIKGSYETPLMIRRKSAKNKIGRNEPCSCGSGRKYKKCCKWKEDII